MYEKIDFSHLLGTSGFSDNLLNTHFGLYEGYVKNTNVLAERLKELSTTGLSGPGEYAELKRRFGWEFNGMRLHELYFENMSKEAVILEENSDLGKMITMEFGSIDAWRNDFVSTGTLRGIGWAILTYDQKGKRLFNTWVNEHDVGNLAGSKPLLVMDIFEHAFILDYGMKRADYIQSFIHAIDWNKVNERLKN